MNLFKKIILFILAIFSANSIVSCDGFLDSLETTGQEDTSVQLDNSEKVKVTFYNLSESETPIMINEQNKDATLVIPQKIRLNATLTNFGKKGTSTEKKKYVFNGWVDFKNDPRNLEYEPISSDYIVKEDISLYACYKIKEITYTFYNMGTVLDSGTCIIGNKFKYKGSTPTRSSDNNGVKYEFNGWVKSRYGDDIGDGTMSDEFTAESNNMNLHAVYKKTNIKFKVTWMNQNTQYGEDSFEYGSNPTFSRATPSRSNEGAFKFVFKGWNESRQSNDVGTFVPLTSYVMNKDYTLWAVYEKVESIYSVTWHNDDGTNLGLTDTYQVGKAPKFNSSNPVKAGTSNGIKASEYKFYEFAGWTRTKGSNVVDSTILTNPINDTNNDEPYHFYAVYKVTIIGAGNTTLPQLINDGVLIISGGGFSLNLVKDSYSEYEFTRKNYTNLGLIPYTYNGEKITSVGMINNAPTLKTLVLYEGITTIQNISVNGSYFEVIKFPSTLTEIGFGSLKCDSNKLVIYYNGTKEKFMNINGYRTIVCKKVVFAGGYEENSWW